MRNFLSGIFVLLSLFLTNCGEKKGKQMKDSTVRLVTLDPGHFHSALVQKSMYEGVDSVVYVFAPEGPDLESHLKLVESYNSRENDPTSWKEEIYTGPDYLKAMLSKKPGNVVVIAGNNKMKSQYILQSVEAGLNVLADKPMAIDSTGFASLLEAFKIADRKKVLLYDIMTERYEITSILQKEFVHLPEVFGELEKGTEENPAVTKESVHHFYKTVSGAPLVRPAWFFDVNQQGEGIVDITTHMVDLIQWECFPETALDYKKDVQILSARRWPTDLSLEQFKEVTKQTAYPSYLANSVHDGVLSTYSNGELNYSLKGIHAKISVSWDFKAPEGTGDTHFSVIRGTKANVIIRQGKDQNYKPALYVEPLQNSSQFETALLRNMSVLAKKYAGLSAKKSNDGWEIIIPDEFKVGHEAHFTQVTRRYLEYLRAGKLPEWEVPNMITKYYTTTQAREVALKNK